ncbi:MAG TPA: hypothetical protein PKJ95_07730 [Atribacterota bacterium]|nr:hypothetical protein [Atribacterota bacterium]
MGIISELSEKVNTTNLYCKCRICSRHLLENSIYSYYGYCFYHYPIGESDGDDCFPGKLGYKDISGENREKLYTISNSHFENNTRNISSEIQFHTGDIIEQYQYEKPIVTGLQDVKRRKKKKKNNRNKKKHQDIENKREERRKQIQERSVNLDNLRRSRSRKKKEIRRIVNSNCTNDNKKYCSFFTCTYKDNFLDEYKAREDINKFIKRLQYNYPGKEEDGRFLDFTQYLWAVERQKRGSVHFHIIFFNCPYLHWSKYQEEWGKGTIDIHQVRYARNAGSYVCKYFTDYDEQFFDNPIIGRTWGKSRNLKNSIIKRFSEYQGCLPCYKVLKTYTYHTEINGYCLLRICKRE